MYMYVLSEVPDDLKLTFECHLNQDFKELKQSLECDLKQDIKELKQMLEKQAKREIQAQERNTVEIDLQKNNDTFSTNL